MTVRLATAVEYEEVGAITVAAYTVDGYLDAERSYAKVLHDAEDRARQAELWVGVEGEELVGTVTICPTGSTYRELAVESDQGEFRMLAVAPHARRRGVARALVNHCIARSRQEGHREIVICSVDTMASAHALYESIGFVRAPELDWSPVAGILLWGYRLPL